MTIILTNCTNRKKGIVDAELLQASLNPGSIDSVTQQWLAKLNNSHAQNPARDIYCGRSFRESETASRVINCALYVVSAGLGIVSSDTPIPTYNLSIASSDGISVLSKVNGKKSPELWWSKITIENPFGTSLINILNKHPNELILFALSRTYLKLIRDELLQFPVNQQPRLRFFGKNLHKDLPAFLIESWMPYDDRLDGVEQGFSGTQNDFSQRALRHFVSRVLNECEYGDTHLHRSMIFNTLSLITKRETPRRQRLNDYEICKAICDNWAKGKGQSGLLMRIIRDELNIACEQSRFRNIYHLIKNTI